MTARMIVRSATALALGVVLILLSACRPDESDQKAAPAAPTQVVTTNAAEERARDEIQDVYSGYLEAYIKASATADYRTAELAKYVGEPLLGQLLNNLQNMSRSGVHNEGRPTWHPTVTELRLDAGQAVIQDCFDATNWNTVGGKTQPTTQAKKYPVFVKAKRVNGKWYVYESTAQRSATC